MSFFVFFFIFNCKFIFIKKIKIKKKKKKQTHSKFSIKKDYVYFIDSNKSNKTLAHWEEEQYKNANNTNTFKKAIMIMLTLVR